MKPFVRLWLSTVVAAASLQTGGWLRADEQPSGTPIPSAEPPAALPADTAPRPADPLVALVEEAVETSTRRYLDGDVHTPWQIVHGLLAYRHNYEIKLQGEKANAMKWVAGGPYYKGEPWWEKTQYGGRGHRYTMPYAFEGHPNQFLAILTLSALPTDFTFQAAGGEITVADIVRNAQMDVNAKEEITWTLWFLSFYLEPDAQWTNKDGESWSIERLVQMQIAEPPYNAPCGGTHGLFALSRARNAYLQTGRPLRGVWLEADQKIKRYVAEARGYQNPDGTFSSNFFKGRQHSSDFKTRLGSSGHTLEFLMAALSDAELNEEWVRRGVHAIAKELMEHKADPAECGALYHSLDALVIYLERVHGKPQLARTATPLPADPRADVQTTKGAPEINPVSYTVEAPNVPVHLLHHEE